MAPNKKNLAKVAKKQTHDDSPQAEEFAVLPASHVCNIVVVYGTANGGFVGMIWNYITIRVVALGPKNHVGNPSISCGGTEAYISHHKQHLKTPILHMSHKKSLRILAIESWLFDRDPFIGLL